MKYSAELVFLINVILMTSLLTLWLFLPVPVLIFHLSGLVVIYVPKVWRELREGLSLNILILIIFLPIIGNFWYLDASYELIKRYQKYKFSKIGIEYVINYHGINDGIEDIIATISNPKDLKKIITHARCYDIRDAVIDSIEDEAFLKDIILNAVDSKLRRYTVHHYRSLFDDDETIKQIILKYPYHYDNRVFVKLIHDPEVLEDMLLFLDKLNEDGRSDLNYITDIKERLKILKFNSK